MSRLRYLATLTPMETWRIARQRLPGLRGGASWTAAELMSSAKHARGIRFAELILRQQVVIVREIPSWQPVDFESKSVVEVGCGPLAGFGPLAVFCGARVFQSAEPEWDPKLFYSAAVVDKYLRILHADLTALYGPRLTFDQFQTALNERLLVTRLGFEEAPIEGPVDLVLSQSVLEHVFPIAELLTKLREIQSNTTRFVHLVDFGNHYPTATPFEGLYDTTPEQYIASRGRAINCLRSSDIMDRFSAAGIAARIVPSRVLPDAVPTHVNSWWERYPRDVLATQLALVVSPH